MSESDVSSSGEAKYNKHIIKKQKTTVKKNLHINLGGNG